MMTERDILNRLAVGRALYGVPPDGARALRRLLRRGIVIGRRRPFDRGGAAVTIYRLAPGVAARVLLGKRGREAHRRRKAADAEPTPKPRRRGPGLNAALRRIAMQAARADQPTNGRRG